MLKEFIESIVKLGQAAHKPEIVKLPAEPAHRYLLARPDGSCEILDAEPEPRDHECLSIPEFVSFCLTWCELPSPSPEEPKLPATYPVVWFSRDGVTAILDDDTRRDQVTLPVALSPQLLRLKQIEASKPSFSQFHFVRLLRIELEGCLSAHPTLVDLVRKVKFRIDQAGASEVQHGKQSIGKSLESELTGSGTIPERIELRVPVFDTILPVLFPVQCAIEINPNEQTFQLIPFPGQVEKAIRQAEETVGAQLREGFEGQDGICCYYGRQ